MDIFNYFFHFPRPRTTVWKKVPLVSRQRKDIAEVERYDMQGLSKPQEQTYSINYREINTVVVILASLSTSGTRRKHMKLASCRKTQSSQRLHDCGFGWKYKLVQWEIMAPHVFSSPQYTAI